MAVISAYKTDTGLVSRHNQDYVWVDDRKGVFVVADGMGGHEAGDVASRMAAGTVGEEIVAGLAGHPVEAAALKTLLAGAIEIANQKVWAASGEAAQKRRMGATIVLAVIQPPLAYIAHAGDARAYMIRDNAITRLTEDDSWVAHLLSSGLIAEGDAMRNRLSHVITKAIGQDGPVEPTVSDVAVKPGDWLLLCSDGLWNMVSDEEILT
ncbi:MAG: PP2C family protein-serine/threonine phosphatase, partial [Anaerolineae bacterium]